MANALVPLAPTGRETADLHVGNRGNVDFIAHLIATSMKAPQTRARRRVTPDEAIAVYRALVRDPLPPGRTLCRSL